MYTVMKTRRQEDNGCTAAPRWAATALVFAVSVGISSDPRDGVMRQYGACRVAGNTVNSGPVGDVGGKPAPARTAKKRQRAIAAAERELDLAGITNKLKR